MTVDQNLTNLSGVIGGFAEALTALIALATVPFAFWQIRHNRKIASIESFYAGLRELFQSADDLVVLIDERFKYLHEKYQNGIATDYEQTAKHILFETSWARFSANIAQILFLYQRTRPLIGAEELHGAWCVVETVRLHLELVLNAEDLPEDDGTEFGLFVWTLSENHNELVDWLEHKLFGPSDLSKFRNQKRQLKSKRKGGP